MFDVRPSGRYLRVFHIRQCVVFIRLVRNGSLLIPLFPTSQFILNVGLYTICLQLLCASAGITSLIVLEPRLYMFRKVSFSIFLLVGVKLCFHY